MVLSDKHDRILRYCLQECVKLRQQVVLVALCTTHIQEVEMLRTFFILDYFCSLYRLTARVGLVVPLKIPLQRRERARHACAKARTRYIVKRDWNAGRILIFGQAKLHSFYLVLFGRYTSTKCSQNDFAFILSSPPPLHWAFLQDIYSQHLKEITFCILLSRNCVLVFPLSTYFSTAIFPMMYFLFCDLYICVSLSLDGKRKNLIVQAIS